MPTLSELKASKNINELLTEEKSEQIGRDVFDWYTEDKESRSSWEEKNEQAIQLAQQAVKEKSTPWPKASNVKFPLLTIAALQFHSRAYPALVKAPDLVKYRVQGPDQGGIKAARAARISAHMSYQLLEEDERWEEDQDKLFIVVPIMGCAFKKSYFQDCNKSRLVMPQNLVVNYYAKTIEDCERKTEILPKMSERQYRAKVLKGIYTEHEFGPPQAKKNSEVEDDRQGTNEPPQSSFTPRQPLECHCFLDLDEDGYPEPYVVTIDEDTKKVLRIVNRFGEIESEQSIQIENLENIKLELAQSVIEQGKNPEPTEEDVATLQRVQARIQQIDEQIAQLKQEEPKVLEITPFEHYTKYGFIPAPDGGFYDLGFGVLLGPLNHSVDTLINQMIDSGTLANGSRGFLGKGFRVKGGRLEFSPNEWKKVDVAGSTLRDNIVELPVNPPSAVLFQLLGLIIQYTEKVSSVTEALSGENPGQNTPAYNMNAMLEQGLQLFNAIFKRQYRSFRQELRKMYRLNGLYLNPTEYFEYQDSEMFVLQEDYSGEGKDIIPAADPNAFSNKEKQMKAGMIAQRADMAAGYDRIKVEQQWLEAMDIPNAAELFPVTQDENGAMKLVYEPAPNPDLMLGQQEEARKMDELQFKKWKESQLLAADLALREAQIVDIYARAEKTASEVDVEAMKVLAGELKAQRESILREKEVDAARADRRMEGESGNGGSENGD